MGMMYTDTLKYDQSGRRRRQKAPTGEVFTKYKTTFQPMVRATEPYRRDAGVQYKSADMTKATAQAARNEPQKYTGTLIKGIATMHKSNAVPIINSEEATDIARMRR